MERLTKCIGDCICLNYEKHPNDAINSAYKKLAAYEDTGLTPEQILAMDEEYTKLAKELGEYKRLEEQGILIVLPCRDGDTVYKIDSYYICDYEENYECDCPEYHKCEDEYEEPCEYQYKVYCVAETRFRKEMLAVLGKTIFLTKAEAEKALAEMGE